MIGIPCGQLNRSFPAGYFAGLTSVCNKVKTRLFSFSAAVSGSCSDMWLRWTPTRCTDMTGLVFDAAT